MINNTLSEDKIHTYIKNFEEFWNVAEIRLYDWRVVLYCAIKDYVESNDNLKNIMLNHLDLE